MTELLATISPKLERLERYVGYLKGYQKHSAEDLRKDHTLRGAVLHYLQLSIECCMDIGEMLISGLGLRKPEDGREVFDILAENGVLQREFASRFSPAAGLRNIIVHQYTDIDMDRIRDHIQDHLADFDVYAKSVARFLHERRTGD